MSAFEFRIFNIYMFTLEKTEEFEKQYRKLDVSEQKVIVKIIVKLQERALSIGDPLCGLRFFREVRLRGKRIYYLVYEESSMVLMVAISNKKMQQATIKNILENLDKYKEFTLRK